MADGKLPIGSFSLPVIVESSPFVESSPLAAYAADTHIIIIQRQIVSRSEEDITGGAHAASNFHPTTYNHVYDFYHWPGVRALAWSPLSSSPTIDSPSAPLRIHICSAGMDNKIRLFYADNDDKREVIIGGHSDFINSIAFNFDPNDLVLASTSDDHNVYVWDVETQQLICSMALKAPGRSVKFHPKEPNQLMVADQSGRIKLYDIRGSSLQTAIISTSLDDGSLSEADWNPTDVTQFGAVSTRRWHLWNVELRSNSAPSVHHGTPFASLTHFRWCPHNGNLFAVGGSQVCIIHQARGTPFRLSAPTRIGNISWCADIPTLMFGSSKFVHWHTTTV